MSTARLLIQSAVVVLSIFAPAHAAEFEIVSWNIESGGNDPRFIAEQIEAFTGVELWALCEAEAKNQRRYARGAGIGEGAFFEPILGTTGGGDRLIVIYNTEFFEALGQFELHDLKFGGGRAPLIVRFKIRQTGEEFLFANNHFHRGNANKRALQARGFRQWANKQKLPVIAVGDYNFDFEVPGGPGNTSFDIMLEEGVFDWVRPQQIVSTQYSDEDEDGENDHNSVLDFVFAAKRPAGWQLTSEIVVREGDFPDDEDESDHRPVLARVTVPDAPVPQPVTPAVVAGVGRPAAPAVQPPRRADDGTLERILQRLESLEAEVRELRKQLGGRRE
jgi:hypothetical protein